MALISNGATIFDNGSVTAGLGGSMNLMKKLTASASANLSFVQGTGGVDFTTYKEYVFILNQIHAASDNVNFGFQANKTGQSGYNQHTTALGHRAYSNESGDSGMGTANAGLAHSQSLFLLSEGTQRNAADESLSGFLHIYDPSNTTHFKCFKGQTMCQKDNTYAIDTYVGGYHATQSAMIGYQFKFHSDNIDTGSISLYGIS